MVKESLIDMEDLVVTKDEKGESKSHQAVKLVAAGGGF